MVTGHQGNVKKQEAEIMTKHQEMRDGCGGRAVEERNTFDGSGDGRMEHCKESRDLEAAEMGRANIVRRVVTTKPRRKFVG